MDIKRSGSQPSGKGPAEYFTGNVRIDPLFEAPDPARVRSAAVTFEPGARTAWHSHDKGQLLLVEAGRLRTQKKGQAIKDLGVGESDYTAPNLVHWHGAVPGQSVVQINVGFGGETKWLEPVTDAEYRK